MKSLLIDSPLNGVLCVHVRAAVRLASPCMNRTDSRRTAPCHARSAGGVLKSCSVCSNGHTLHTYSLTYCFPSNQILIRSACTIKYNENITKSF